MTATVTRPDLCQGIPPLSGRESELASLRQWTAPNSEGTAAPVFLARTNLALDRIQAGFACALHMHQPTIPAGADGSLISNLQYMFDHPHEGDNHNAAVFANCYGRIGDFIPQLIDQGCNPRIMLDYSGNLLWGLEQMGRQDLLDKLRRITQDNRYWPHVEWLGTFWSHAVAPSTPIPDLKLQIQAWQHHFAALFGDEALGRVRGFSPPEMHLPNHPDQLYAFIQALKECGYRWLLAQEHSVEQLDGHTLNQADKYLPNQLIARNSQGETVSMTVLIKTQGSDTKLVAQMQPYFEAKGLSQQLLGQQLLGQQQSGQQQSGQQQSGQSPGQHSVPSLVSQIADGENGGVMMNEYPRDLFRVYHEIRDGGGNQAGTVAINGTEYLELLDAAGVTPADYPVCQAVGQQKIWRSLTDEGANLDQLSSQQVEAAIEHLRQTDSTFHMDGASWTNDLSWVAGYENVLEPMNRLSAKFHQRYDPAVKNNPAITTSPDYQTSLLYLLLLQTSCFRYWGQGTWTEYAQELYRRGDAILGA